VNVRTVVPRWVVSGGTGGRCCSSWSIRWKPSCSPRRFVGEFGDPGDESTADADGILHVANRLMDYHERFLELAERCRALSAPSHCAPLLRDVGRLMDVPLAGYQAFIDEFVARVGEMPELLHYARGTLEAATVELHMDTDDELLERITKQIKQIAVDQDHMVGLADGESSL
jgi:hypothetical protein